MLLQSSIDNGSTWQNVGANGDPDNWYNSTIGWTGRNSTSNGSTGWVIAKHDLTGLGGLSSVFLRVAFDSDSGVEDEGVAFDSVNIYQPSCPDITALAIDSFTDTDAIISWTAGNTETDWEIVVQADGTGVPAGAGTATTTNPHSTSGLTAETAYEVYVRADCGANGISAWVGPIDFTTQAACPDISGITIDSTTDTTATISWTVNGVETDWEIVVQADGTGAPAGAGTATTTNPHTESSLTGNTAYEVYVRADCTNASDGYSNWVGPVTFTTPCGALVPEYVADMSTNVPDACWEEANSGDEITGPSDLGSGTWSASNHNGTPSNRINLWQNTRSDWIISPVFDLSGATPYELITYVALTNGGTSGTGEQMGSDDSVKLLITTDSGTTWTPLQTWAQGSEPTEVGEQITYDLSAQTGNVQFAFLGDEGSIDDSNDVYFHVSQFRVRAIPSCLEITTLAIDSFTDTEAVVSWTAGDTETDWEILVQADNTGLPSGSGTATTTNPHTWSSLTAETAYEVYVRADCGANGFSAWVGPVDFITDPSCIDITDLTIDSFTDTEVIVSWTANDSETDWEILVQADATGAPTGAGTATTTNPHTWSSLTAETAYEVYVRANCAADGFSNWVGPVSFTTACATIAAFPYTEDFEADNTCWTNEMITGTQNWGRDPSGGSGDISSSHGGTGFMEKNYSSSDALLFSPRFDLTAVGADSRVKVWLHRHASADEDDRYKIFANTTTSLTGATQLLELYSKTTIAPTVATTGWYEYTLNIPNTFNTSDSVYIIFQGTTSAGFSSYDLGVDDFVLEPIPSCLEITDLTIDNLTDTEAILSWTAGETEIDWEIVVQADGTGEPTGSGTSISTNPYTASSLTAETAYEVYVRADCVANGFSPWVGPLDFTTACTAIADFSENFDAVTTPALPNCWSSVIDNGAATSAYVETSTSADNSLPNGVRLYGGFTTVTDSNIMLVSPNLSNLGDGTHLLRFFARNTTATQDIEVGTLSNPTDGSTFTPISSVDINTTFTEYEVSFAGYSGTDNYIAIRRVSATSYSSVYLDDIIWEALPPCPKVTDITLDSSTATTANISWTAGNTETDWEIVVQAPGIGEPTGSGTAITANPYTASSLTAQTDYEVYVRADCTAGSNGYSEWVGPLNFTTPCEIYTPDYTEDFTTFLNPCWEQAADGDLTAGPATTGSSGWVAEEFAHVGSGLGAANVNMYSSGDTEWLISPLFDLSSGGYEVVIDVALTDYDGTTTTDTFDADDEVRLVYSLDGTNWTTLQLWNQANTPSSTGDTVITDISTITDSNVQFAIYAAENTGSTAIDIDFHIDNFKVRTPPTCFEVTGITIDSFDVTDVTVSWTAGGTETDWEIVVQEDGLGTPAVAGAATTANPHTESGLTQLTDYEVYVRADCGANGFSAWAGPIDFTTEAACPEISGLTIDSFTATTANISWTVGDAETDWEIVVQADGTGAPTGAGIATATNPHIESGLTGNTAYEVYVRANCIADGFSTWVGPVDFTTDCPAVFIPEYDADMSVNAPDCWEEAGSGEVASGPGGIGSSDWRQGTSYAIGSSNAINLYDSVDREWLISPTFDLSTGGPFQLEVNVAVTNWNSSTVGDAMGADDEVQLLISTDSGLTWSNLTSWNTSNEPVVSGTEYTEDLTAYSGNVQFAIWASDGDVDEGQDYDFHIGKFRVREIPVCLDITGLTIDSFTDTEAVVSWTAGDTETDWEIVVQADNAGLPSGAGTATTTNPHTWSSLTAETAYEVYVRADCGVNGFSEWVGPIDFTTPCTSESTFPYTEDFENAGAIPDCWTSSSSSSRVWAFGTSPTFGNTYNDHTTGSGYFAYVDASTSPNTTTDATLTSPFIDVSSLTTPALEFFVHHYVAGGTNSNTITVEVYDGAAWNTVYTDNDGDVNGWEEVFVNLSTLTITGDIQVRFIIDTAANSNYENDIAIDDVSIIEAPTCIKPTGLTLDSFDRDSVTVSWTNGATETAWEIAVQLDGTGTPLGAGTATTNNPHTESSLLSATAYEVYVRADCGLGDFSTWVGPIDFTTLNPLPTTTATLDVISCGSSGADSYNGAYDASTQNVVWAQLDYTAGCPSLTIDTIGSDFDTEIGIYDANGVFIGSNDDGPTGVTPQSLFTELGLANGTYYIAAGANNTIFGADFDVTSSNTTDTGTLFINASGQSSETADFNNLQWPINGTINEGDTYNVYSRIYEDGITNVGSPGANIEAWIGYNTTDAVTNADFTAGWTWIQATFNADQGNDDEYVADIGTLLSPGVYYYASRFSVDGGPFTYGGIDKLGSGGGNTWDGSDSAASGELTVNSLSIPTTVATFNIAGCGDSDNYNNNAYDAGAEPVIWIELIYDGNCTEITVDTESTSFSDTEIGLYDSFGNKIEEDDDDGTGNLSSITRLGLPAGTYYIAAGAYNMSFGTTDFNVTSTSTTTGTININASTPNFVDFCNLQSPSSGTINVGGNYDVYAQIFENGRTEAAGQGANILSWIGYSSTDATTTADFASGWTWVPATYNADMGSNDEYQAEIGSGLDIGSYYYVSRFSVDGGDFAYGGINPGSTDGNFWDGTNYVSGQITVNPTPEPTNHVLAFTAVADSDSQITLTWDDNDGVQPADGFVIVGKTGAGVFTTIVDGTDLVNDTDWSDDEFEFKRVSGVQSYTVVGLEASTLYEFEIYPYTNAGSIIDFKTDGTVPATSATTEADPCLVAVTTFPFNEGFETGLIPTCWSQEFEAGSVNWTYNNGGQGAGTTITSAHTGSFNAMFYDTSSSAVVKLVSPKLDLTGLTNATLSFWHAQEVWAGSQDELRVYYKTSAAGSWTLIPGQEYLNSIDAWTEETIVLPNPSAEYYIAFEGTGDFGHGVLLDDVKVEEVIAVTYTYTSGTWAPSDPNGNATVNDDIVIVSGDAVISTNTTADNVIVNPGASITINSGITLTVDGNVTLESVSNSYSSLMYDGTIVGTIKYERYVNSNSGGNDLISPPLAGETWSSFLASDTNAADLLDNGQTSPTTYAWAPFDKSIGAYVNYTDATVATLTSGTGYRAATDAGTTLTFTGTVPTTTVPVNITDEGPNHPDWNLVGNPYPSYINMFNFLFYEVGTTGSGVYNYNLLEDLSGIYGYDGDASDGYNVSTLADALDGRLMAPGQGFLLAADGAQVAGYDLTFDPNMRSTGSSDDFIAGRNSNILTYFKLNASNADKNYSTRFYFNEESSQGADHGYDGKVWGTPPSFALYSHLAQENTGLAIALQSLNTSDMMDVVIPLGVNANSGEQLTFTITESTLPTTVDVYLDDTVNNTSTLLNNGDYVITPITNLNGTGRFYLRVSDSSLSTTDEDFNSIKIYTTKSPRSIFISGTINDNTTAKIFDIQGRLVYSTELENRNLLNEIDASDLQDGVYVVTLSDGIKQKSQKVIIR